MTNEEILEVIDSVQGHVATADYLRKALDSESDRRYYEGFYDGIAMFANAMYDASIGKEASDDANG